MANIASDLKVKVIIGEKPEMRPCWVNDGKAEHKALFHCWVHEAYAVPPSAFHEVNGLGGQRSYEAALVELEDGRVTEVHPTCVRFDDTEAAMSEYAWIHDRGEGEDGTV